MFHIKPDDENFAVLLETFTQLIGREPLVVQRYMPEVRKGDKQHYPGGWRTGWGATAFPQGRSARSNMHVGGNARKPPSPSANANLRRHRPGLKRQGLIFVGIDVIGGYLTEINVTSPTGIQEINRFDDISIEDQIWDVIEERVVSGRRERGDPKK